MSAPKRSPPASPGARVLPRCSLRRLAQVLGPGARCGGRGHGLRASGGRRSERPVVAIYTWQRPIAHWRISGVTRRARSNLGGGRPDSWGRNSARRAASLANGMTRARSIVGLLRLAFPHVCLRVLAWAAKPGDYWRRIPELGLSSRHWADITLSGCMRCRSAKCARRRRWCRALRARYPDYRIVADRHDADRFGNRAQPVRRPRDALLRAL